MGRKPEGKSARTRQVNVRLTDEGVAELDRLRGEHHRSAFFRYLLAVEAKKRPKA